MTKNFYLAIAIIVVVVGLSALFFLQQKSIKNPLDNQMVNNFLPAKPAAVTPLPSVTPIVSPTSTASVQPSSQSGNMVTMTDGLKVQDLTVGTGSEVKPGDTVAVNYLGTLENGDKFDSSYDRNQPFVTQIGVGRVIKGWDKGIVGMKVGGKRKLIIPPGLGYGTQSAGSIPPNSTLIFEVELVAIK